VDSPAAASGKACAYAPEAHEQLASSSAPRSKFRSGDDEPLVKCVPWLVSLYGSGTWKSPIYPSLSFRPLRAPRPSEERYLLKSQPCQDLLDAFL